MLPPPLTDPKGRPADKPIVATKEELFELAYVNDGLCYVEKLADLEIPHVTVSDLFCSI